MFSPSHYQPLRQAYRRDRRRNLTIESMEQRRLLAVLTVNTDQDVVDADDGLTSLREAIVTANSLPGADEIVFDFGHDDPATIQLEQGELQLTDAVAITGAGPELLTIDARQQSRIFNITAENGDFAIDGLTLTNGQTTGRQARTDTTYNGGAIRSLTSGSLTIHNSAVTNSSTSSLASGGGLFAEGDVTVSFSTISGNSASFNGGGFYTSGDLTLNSSTIEGNSARSHGGGINSTGTVTLSSSEILANVAGDGGGIEGLTVHLNSSTISGNLAIGGEGGAVDANNVTVTSSTISGNSARGKYGRGGGIHAGNVTISSSTISGNSARWGGGGIHSPSPGDVTVANSILSGNENKGGGSDLNYIPGRLSVSYSLIGNNRGSNLPEAPAGSPDPDGNLIGGPVGGVIDPLLGPLSDNGGPTFTHALLPGSPAIDAGDPFAVAGSDDAPLHDQRGAPYANMVDGNNDGVARIDMGAHERQNLTANILSVSSPTVTPVNEVTIQFTSAARNFDLGNLRLSLNGGENLLTGNETLSSNDNQMFVLRGIADAATVAGYYTLTLKVSASDITDASGNPLDSEVSASWAVGRSIPGLFVNTLADETDGRIDDGDVSLRDAINAAAPGETIEFDASLDGGTILLTLGELLLTRPLTIDATELNGGLVIDATGNDPTPTVDDVRGRPIFEIDDGNPIADSPVTIRGLTLTGGAGSAIGSEESLSIERASIEGNARGGIDAWADVYVTSSTISGNSGGSEGGGISGNAVTVKSSTISENSGVAGGIAGSEVEVAASTISGNKGLFGGVYAHNDVAVSSSTISGNSAARILGFSGYGGGIMSHGNVTVSSSTISGNTASDGGGIFAEGNVTVISSTIWGNLSGGGISNFGDTTITNSIVAGNDGPDLDHRESLLQTSPIWAIRHSLIGDSRGTNLTEAPLGSPDANGNLIGGPVGGIIDPLLGPLADNGGPTLTHALLPGSPAIDAGDPRAVAGSENVPLFDQRDAPFSRIVGGRIDMGAIEHGASDNRPVGDSNGDGVFDSSDLVMVFQAGKYEDELANNATFDEGDWNGDGGFDTSDLVFAFQTGNYVSAATPFSAVAAALSDDRDELLA